MVKPELTEAEKAERRARNAAKRAERSAKAAQAGARERAGRSDAPEPEARRDFNILAVVQAGPLEAQALLFAASLRANSPGWGGRLVLAEPRPEGKWAGHATLIGDQTRALLTEMGAEITPFTAAHFGADYPQGNKIEALSLLPQGEPFVFFDTDTLFLGPLDQVAFDFARPSASMRREGTWPDPPLYGPGYGAIWRGLYERFGLDYESSLDRRQPDEHWERYLYFNAGWFFGADPAVFGARMLDYALSIRDAPGEALASQQLYPWLDQIVLPLVIHSLGGGRPGRDLAGLDGEVSCHYRNLPLLYARESDRAIEVLEEIAAQQAIKQQLRGHEAAAKLIYQGKGREKIRALFDQNHLPSREAELRREIRRAGWWLT
ncbi:MAG: hypothetical protein Q4F71_11305 [Paracoccus sp. (in: a-proteobacteria)]|nr:hypothetical protein [Paracoccus sp. (in: a-proteobacteria)]